MIDNIITFYLFWNKIVHKTMGLLKVAGGVLTYNQYKDKIETYKKHGMSQFKSNYAAHKDKYIELKDLKWGEEMEYSIYKYDAE